jgi:hypothetical protein
MAESEILDVLKIIPTDQLLQHEQTLPQNIGYLKETMLNIGRLVDPLIIDKEHKIVLDGNHRLHVLRDISAQNVAVQVVDYFDPGIKIGGWHPMSKDFKPEMFEDHPENVDFEHGMAELDAMKGCFLMVRNDENGKKKCKLFDSCSHELRQVVEQQNALLSNFSGMKIEYVEDFRADEFLSRGYTVLYRRMFRKEDVVKEALAKNPLPPKSTRHIIPNRIIRLNLPLGMLSEPQESAEIMMREFLLKRINTNAVRRYTEPVIVIY